MNIRNICIYIYACSSNKNIGLDFEREKERGSRRVWRGREKRKFAIIISKLEKLKNLLLNLCKSSRTGVPENSMSL